MSHDARELKERLIACIDALRIPGAAIAVHNGGIEAAAAAGSANVEADIAANDHTIFQIGSVTKAFTATLVAKLASEGRIDFEAPVRRYLPGLRIAGVPVPDSLTVRTLLDYSAGMEGDFFGDFGPDPSALARYVDACSDLIWVHEPGTMRSYCSTSYCIAGRLVEVITGLTFENALSQLLLRPLGMERFAFYREDVARYRVAVGHRYDAVSQGFRVVEHLRLPHSMAAAGASLTMTATELLRFGLLHAYDGALPGGPAWISPEHIRDLRNPTSRVPPNDSELICAWATLPTDKGRLIVASGATIEQNAFLVLLPEARFALAILANTGGGADRLMLGLGAEILKECTGATMQLPSTVPSGLTLADADLNSISVSEFEGDYRNVAHCTVRREGNRLRLHMETDDTVAKKRIRQSATLVRTSLAREFAVWIDDAPASHTVLSFLVPQDSGGPAVHLSMAHRLYVRV